MKTLNEQIERLKELVRKCYGAVAGKNGTVPEVGERNMENLPAAIGSIKSASDIPKIKVSSFKVTNDCINEEGRWEGETLIDTNKLTSLQDAFSKCTSLKSLNINDWDVSNVTKMGDTFNRCSSLKSLNINDWDVSNVIEIVACFSNCTSLQELDLSSWNPKASNIQYIFNNCSNLEILDISNWYAGNVTNCNHAFALCNKLRSLIGRIGSDTSTCLNGLKISLSVETTALEKSSLLALINGLADLTGQTTQTLTIGTGLIAKLTKEDIAIAVNKNWTIA